MLTHKRCKELFNYHNGQLYWATNWYDRRIGDVAGWCGVNGYRYVSVDGKSYLLHRVIWLWNYGYFPENDIDHINRDKEDNRIENLREVSRQCNCRNSGDRCDNVSGVKGVSWKKELNKWCVRINVNNKNSYLGVFENFDEAVLTRLAAEQCVDWHKCNMDSSAYKYAIEQGLTT